MKMWVFGTSPLCDVRVDDEYVSTKHCKVLLHDDGTVTLEDLGSMNGTWVRPDDGTPREGLQGALKGYGVRVYDQIVITPPCVIRIGRTDVPWRLP